MKPSQEVGTAERHSALRRLAFSGFLALSGVEYSQSTPVDTSAVAGPAPAAAYLTERYGNMTDTMSGLTSGTSCRMRLHFPEIYVSGSGQRKFNVSINGAQVLTDFDIHAVAGGKFKANVQECTAAANASGQILLQFVSVVNNARISAIEVQGL